MMKEDGKDDESLYVLNCTIQTSLLATYVWLLAFVITSKLNNNCS